MDQSRRPDLNQFECPAFVTDIRGVADHVNNGIFLPFNHAFRPAERKTPAIALVAGEFGLDLGVDDGHLRRYEHGDRGFRDLNSSCPVEVHCTVVVR